MVDVDYGIETKGAQASIRDLVSKMNRVMERYRKALDKGKRAARDIEQKFTWDDTGRKLKDIIERFLRHGIHSN